MNDELKIRWYDPPTESLAFEIQYPAESAALKKKMVEKLTGETVPEGVKPYDAYLNFLCRINGIDENTRPLPAPLANMLLEERGACQFLFWLA